MPLRHSKLKSPKLYWFQSLRSYRCSGNAFSARSKLVKSQTRFGLFGPSVETKDQWMTFRFGCIGNCAIRNAESFSDKWSSESEPRASVTENMRVSSVRLAVMCGENANVSLWLIRVGDGGGWSFRVLSQGRNLPSATSALCRRPRPPLSSNFSLRNCRRPGDYLDANS